MNMKDLERFDLNAPSSYFPAFVRNADPAKRILPAGIDTDRAFTFSAQISNQQVDSYFTRMARTSLNNYAIDAQEGVAFLDSHQHDKRIGYSYRGEFRDGENPNVIADFYTVRGLKLGELDTDNFIQGVEFGLIRDVSIGFKEGEGFEYTCSICGDDLFSWDCIHIPGMTYKAVSNPDADPAEQIEEERLCIAWIENARLSEVSAVYDGATPDAMIVKATREHRAGRLKSDAQLYLERRRIVLPESKLFTGANLNREKEQMSDTEKPSGAPDKLLVREVAIEARAVGLTVKEDATVQDVVSAFRTEVERLKPFEKLATEGQQLRTLLVDETIAEGVRAFGESFDEAAKRTMLTNLDIETIGTMRTSWREIADAKFAGKSRQSSDNPDGDEKDEDEEDEKEAAKAPATTPTPEVPDDAAGGV